MKKTKPNSIRRLKSHKLILFLLSLCIAGVIKSTEVYVCEWIGDIYNCYRISEPTKEKEEPSIVVTEPEPEEITVYDY